MLTFKSISDIIKVKMVRPLGTKNSTTLSDLPAELLIKHIFPYLSPRDIARLLRVNVRLNSLVHSYLRDLSSLKMYGREQWGTCTTNCFKFITSETTKLISIRISNWRVTNEDLLPVILRNPNLKTIDLTGAVSGFEMSSPNILEMSPKVLYL